MTPKPGSMVSLELATSPRVRAMIASVSSPLPAAGLLFFGGMDELDASIRRATEINLAPRHYTQEVAHWFGDRNLPLCCNRRRHCRTDVRSGFLKVLLRGAVFKSCPTAVRYHPGVRWHAACAQFQQCRIDAPKVECARMRPAQVRRVAGPTLRPKPRMMPRKCREACPE